MAVKPYLKEDELVTKQDEKLSQPNIGNRVEFYWPRDDQYYPGVVHYFNPRTQKHHIDYDDGDQEDPNLSTEK